MGFLIKNKKVTVVKNNKKIIIIHTKNVKCKDVG